MFMLTIFTTRFSVLRCELVEPPVRQSRIYVGHPLVKSRSFCSRVIASTTTTRTPCLEKARWSFASHAVSRVQTSILRFRNRHCAHPKQPPVRPIVPVLYKNHPMTNAMVILMRTSAVWQEQLLMALCKQMQAQKIVKGNASSYYMWTSSRTSSGKSTRSCSMGLIKLQPDARTQINALLERFYWSILDRES